GFLITITARKNGSLPENGDRFVNHTVLMTGDRTAGVVLTVTWELDRVVVVLAFAEVLLPEQAFRRQQRDDHDRDQQHIARTTESFTHQRSLQPLRHEGQDE